MVYFTMFNYEADDDIFFFLLVTTLSFVDGEKPVE